MQMTKWDIWGEEGVKRYKLKKWKVADGRGDSTDAYEERWSKK